MIKILKEYIQIKTHFPVYLITGFTFFLSLFGSASRDLFYILAYTPMKVLYEHDWIACFTGSFLLPLSDYNSWFYLSFFYGFGIDTINAFKRRGYHSHLLFYLLFVGGLFSVLIADLFKYEDVDFLSVKIQPLFIGGISSSALFLVGSNPFGSTITLLGKTPNWLYGIPYIYMTLFVYHGHYFYLDLGNPQLFGCLFGLNMGLVLQFIDWLNKN